MSLASYRFACGLAHEPELASCASRETSKNNLTGIDVEPKFICLQAATSPVA